MEFFRGLWNDEQGEVVNKFLRDLAKVLMAISGFFAVAGVIATFILLGLTDGAAGSLLCFISGLVLALFFLVGAVNLLWLSTLGNNIIKIAQQDNADSEDYSELPTL